MCDPEHLQRDSAENVYSTEDLRNWARQKRKKGLITSVDPRLKKEFPVNFRPAYCSTPVRLEKKRTSLINRPGVINEGGVVCVVDTSNEVAQENDENILTSINDQFDRMFTNGNKADESVYTVTPKKSTSHGMPAMQSNVFNNPVQVQVKQEEQQAEPHIMKIISQRIQPRPPIRGQSKKIETPSNYVPSVTSIGTPIAKAPVIVPPPVTVITETSPRQKATHTPTTTTLTLIEGNGVTSSSAQNTEPGPMIILRTPANQSNQFAPAPHITINLNVGNSLPQTPLQIQTIYTYDQNTENTKNGSDQRISTDESFMTNDSDSIMNAANVCDSGCDVTQVNSSNVSAHQASLPIHEAEQTRHTAIFNEVDKLTQPIDNLTQTIQEDSAHFPVHGNQFRARSNNNITNANTEDAPDKDKRKKKVQSTGKVSGMKKPSQSESKSKRSKADEHVEFRPSKDTLPREVGSRRSKRERKQTANNYFLLHHYCWEKKDPIFLLRQDLLKQTNHSKAEKRKSEAAQSVHHTSHAITTQNDPENEPPRKKSRT